MGGEDPTWVATIETARSERGELAFRAHSERAELAFREANGERCWRLSITEHDDNGIIIHGPVMYSLPDQTLAWGKPYKFDFCEALQTENDVVWAGGFFAGGLMPGDVRLMINPTRIIEETQDRVLSAAARRHFLAKRAGRDVGDESCERRNATARVAM